MQAYFRTALILGRNFILRSARSLPISAPFVLLPVVLLLVFGLIGQSSGENISGQLVAFSGLSLMMLGVVGLATVLPADKKLGVLRRLQATPFKTSQLMMGFMLSSMVLCGIAIASMLVAAEALFGFQMQGSYPELILFILMCLAMTVSIGVAIGGWARTDSAASFVGQLIFLSSLGLSGAWFSRDLLPDWLHVISTVMPMTPIIQGLHAIIMEGKGLFDLGSQLAIVVGWIVVAYALGTKLFRWESDPS